MKGWVPGGDYGAFDPLSGWAGVIVKPGTQGIANPKATGLLDQNEECGLERVLGFMRVYERAEDCAGPLRRGV